MSRKELIGWALFMISGLVFLAGGILNGDWWSITASIPWLLGCAIFIRN